MFNNLLLNKRGGPFSWKYFAMSHDKGVIDGIGGKAKALSKSYEYSRWQNHCSVIKWFLKSSTAGTKQNKSDSHFTGRNFLQNIRSYSLKLDKIIGSA